MPARADLRVAIVIPAFQAAATIGDVVSGAQASVPEARVIVVDDGSRDGTAAAASRAGADVLGHDHNLGKGAALQTGMAEAVSRGAGVIVTLDADGQHDPAAIPDLVAPVQAAQADLVLGARRRAGAMPPQRRLSNWLSSILASRVGRDPIPDAQTGFRAFTRGLALAVKPRETRYEYELAFLLGALAAGYRVRSVPVATIYAGTASHFRSVADTWRVARVFARFGGRILAGAGAA